MRFARRKPKVDPATMPTSGGASSPARARARPKQDGTMNQLEADYSLLLEQLRVGGVITRWDFEPVKLRLADRTFYTPDFRVLCPDGLEEFHEVKGFWEEDARIKIKVAAAQHPYTFVGATKRSVKLPWKFEVFAGISDVPSLIGRMEPQASLPATTEAT